MVENSYDHFNKINKLRELTKNTCDSDLSEIHSLKIESINIDMYIPLDLYIPLHLYILVFFSLVHHSDINPWLYTCTTECTLFSQCTPAMACSRVLPQTQH